MNINPLVGFSKEHRYLSKAETAVSVNVFTKNDRGDWLLTKNRHHDTITYSAVLAKNQRKSEL